MKVVHCKLEPYTHYIGRPSRKQRATLGTLGFGNPYPITDSCTRENAIQLYETWARSQPILLKMIAELPEDAVLGCWCKPKACHGDVIMKLWKELHV